MSRKVSSQWDFGELFPTEQVRKVFSVAELTGKVRQSLEKEYGQLWVNGEISNLRAQSSGHIYFTLKDASAQLSCVLFRSERVENRNLLLDGQRIIAQGNLTVYEPRGQYQLRIVGVEFQGIGALQIAFEKLKQKLLAEGLFAQERKRPIPPMPQRIGLVTSPTGAAIRDVLHVIDRRHPGLEIILAPCRVQGEGAGAEIAEAIRLLNEFNAPQPGSPGHGLDLILVTRGGGSLEDLWAFNEEVVARAIAASGVPVVSAIGHEIDFTIADFVADLRAATPSAAAEIITEGAMGARQFLAGAIPRMKYLAEAGMDELRMQTDHVIRRLGRVHPRLVVDRKFQRLDDLRTQLVRTTSFQRKSFASSCNLVMQRWRQISPQTLLTARKDAVIALVERIRDLARQRISEQTELVNRAAERLRLLSPQGTLARGYSITTDATTGKVVQDAAMLKPGQRLSTRLRSGAVNSRVEGQ